MRKRICEGLNFLGIEIDDDANGRHAPRISTDTGSSVTVRVMRTDEESVIAALSIPLLGFEST